MENNAIQIFNYKEQQVRTAEINGEIWFVAKDVCDVLGIQNTTQAIQSLDEDERSMFLIGRQGEANVISEPGLYALVLRSNKPEAKQFSRWVRHEVLPSIRKHGAYLTPHETDSHRKRMSDFDHAMKHGKEVYSSMGFKGIRPAVALDKIYKDYLGFSALELAGIDPNKGASEVTPYWIRRILDYMQEHECVRPIELAQELGIKYDTAAIQLKRMARQGYLRKIDYGVYSL